MGDLSFSVLVERWFAHVWFATACVFAFLGVHAFVRSFRSGGASRAALRLRVTGCDLAVIALATVALAAAVVPFAAWGFTEDTVFLNYFLRGWPYPFPIWFDIGRFWPLGQQEWRLVYWWTSDVRAYHALALLQFVAFALAVASVLRENGRARSLVLLAIITAAPVAIVFGNLVLPERSQVLFFAIWLWSYRRYSATRERSYLYLNLLCAHFFLYLKEPTALFLAVFATFGLLEHAVRARPREEVLLDLGLLASAAVYLAVYVAGTGTAMLTNGKAYAGTVFEISNVLPALEGWWRKDPVLVVLLAAGLPLAASIAGRHGSGFWPRVLFGAGAYFAMLLVGNVLSVYYTALPAVAVSLAVWYMLPQAKLPRPLVTWTCLLVIALNVTLAGVYFAYRHDWLDRNAQLLDRLERDGDLAVFVAEGNRWDVCSLALYARRARNVELRLDVATPDVSCAPIADDTGYRASALPGQTVLRLGKLIGERRASIEKDGSVVWSYTDTYARVVKPLLPPSLERFVRGHYTHW